MHMEVAAAWPVGGEPDGASVMAGQPAPTLADGVARVIRSKDRNSQDLDLCCLTAVVALLWEHQDFVDRRGP